MQMVPVPSGQGPRYDYPGPGVLVGHVSDFKNVTGCTVVLCPLMKEVRGSAGTRQMDALVGFHIVNEVHGVCITGGSAFGLDAAGGAWNLEERGRGFDVTVTRVPIVPTAVLTCRWATAGGVRTRPWAMPPARPPGQPQGDGSVGAGIGATVGEVPGSNRPPRAGWAPASWKGPRACGWGPWRWSTPSATWWTPKPGRSWPGPAPLRRAGNSRIPSRLIRQGLCGPGFGEPTNTTIGVVATNARLTREEAQKIAQMSHNGLARCIRPVHTLFDGDAVFVLAQPQVDSDLHDLGVLAETALEQAIMGAVKAGPNLGSCPPTRK